MKLKIAGCVAMAIAGLYGASWAVELHMGAWWAFPTMMMGVFMIMAALAIGVCVATKGDSA